MKLETDPVKIKQLSLTKEGENWGFRSFLKSCEIPGDTIDASVQKFFKHVSKKIDCRKCGNCCKENRPVLTRDDVVNIAKRLKVPAAGFEKDYLEKTGTASELVFNRKPCPFLEDNSCSIYDSRPQNCLSYPYGFQKGFTQKLIGIIQNCAVCPIIYNVFELLKEEIWGMDDLDPDSDDSDADDDW